MHGGPIRQMMLGFHYMDYYHNAYAENQYLASRGYAVLSVNYRLGVMYGRAFREAPNTVWRGAAEYKDVVAAGRYLQQLPEVDRDKIGLWGGSYGGFLTAMGLARDSDLFKAGVDFHGVHDWSVFLTERPYFGNLALRPPDADAAVKLAWESSPECVHQYMEVAGPADSRRRRSQRPLQPNGGSGAALARAARTLRADDPAG